MSFGAVLFDLDGTLVDTIGYWIEAYLETLLDVDIHIDTEEFLLTTYTLNKHFEDVLEYYGIDPSRAGELRASRDKRYTDILRTRALWLEGAEDMLRSTTEKYPTAIITGSHKSYIDAMDTQIQLKSLVSTIITTDDMGGRTKPHPHGLLLASKELEVAPEQCIYIGDQVFDIEAANAAGMTSCLFWTEYTPPTAGENADMTVESLAEISSLLGL